MCSYNVDTFWNGFIPGSAAFRATVAERRRLLGENLSLIFKKAAPDVLEIGAGHGHFLNAYAAAHRDHHCLGIDLMTDRVRRATKKKERSRLDNLFFLRAEAAEVLQCLPPGATFRRVFVLFPDPWPKKRHHKNRLLSGPFLHSLATWCRPGAELHFRTDFEPYFEEVRATVANHPSWDTLTAPPWPFEEATVFQQRAQVFHSLSAARVPEKQSSS